MSTGGSVRVRYVILHKPGPRWVKGIDFREQAGVENHVSHYRAVFEAGKLEWGGPFLTPDSGGLMIPIQSLTEAEARQIAESDPAVQSGLLEAEV